MHLEQAGVHTRMHIKSCNTPQVHVAVDVVVVVQYYCFFVFVFDVVVVNSMVVVFYNVVERY